jgi:hypothetical protein
MRRELIIGGLACGGLQKAPGQIFDLEATRWAAKAAFCEGSVMVNDCCCVLPENDREIRVSSGDKHFLVPPLIS